MMTGAHVDESKDAPLKVKLKARRCSRGSLSALAKLDRAEPEILRVDDRHLVGESWRVPEVVPERGDRAGGGTEVILKRFARARCLRLRIDPKTGQAVLTLPKRTSRAEALRFLVRHQGWILAQQKKLAGVRPFVPGARFEVFGQDVELVHDPSHRGRASFGDGRLVVNGDVAFFSRRVRDFVQDECAVRFAAQAHVFAEQLGVKVKRVTIRDTVSRWGSCSADQSIRLCWRLAFAPEAVTRYVIAHEVAHCLEMNHSPAFWAHVESLVGDVWSERAWLAHNGGQLMRIGVVV